MKKFYLFFIFSCFTPALFAQVLFTYGSSLVTKDEFLRAYNKNKTAVADKTIALKEYLDLYIKFKLKVKAAKDMRLDTLASLNNDLTNFRAQIEDNYFNDNATLDKMVDEAFMRSQEDIRVAHLSIPTHPWDYKDQ